MGVEQSLFEVIFLAVIFLVVLLGSGKCIPSLCVCACVVPVVL